MVVLVLQALVRNLVDAFAEVLGREDRQVVVAAEEEEVVAVGVEGLWIESKMLEKVPWAY